jgi:hypothetical protein
MVKRKCHILLKTPDAVKKKEGMDFSLEEENKTYDEEIIIF